MWMTDSLVNIIQETLESGLVRPYDEPASRKFMPYVPFLGNTLNRPCKSPAAESRNGVSGKPGTNKGGYCLWEKWPAISGWLRHTDLAGNQ